MNIEYLKKQLNNIKNINDSTNNDLKKLVNKIEKPKNSFIPETFNSNNNYLDNMGELYGLFICMFLIEDYLKRMDSMMNVYEVD